MISAFRKRSAQWLPTTSAETIALLLSGMPACAPRPPVLLHSGDHAFIEGFDIKIDVSQSFTNDITLLKQGIQKLRRGGGTAIFDALHKTCHDQMLTVQGEGAVRRILILVSDGEAQ